jgi:dephospho-CoA kinase
MGSGKSTVADLLVERGAVLIDADRIAREVVTPDGPAFDPLVERFGPGILAPDGTLDRAALAAIVFPDPAALASLNAITHPAISAVMTERRAAEEDTGHIVVLDVPLLAPAHRDVLSLDAVVVVDCPVEVALDRLVEQRGFRREDAEARMAAQPGREERCLGADFVIDNSSDRHHLEEGVARVWVALTEWSQRRPGGPEPADTAPG